MKKTTTQILLCLSLVLATLGCNTGSSHEAKALLSKAKEALEQGDYNAVRLWADSIDAAFITDSTARWQALRLVRQAELAQSRQNLKQIDSILPIVQARCSEELKQFERQQADEDRIATYSLAPFQLGKTISQSSIRMACDTLGKLYTESIYVGNRAIKHSAIRLSDRNRGARVCSSIIPHDQALNYRYEVDGKQFEILTYPDEDSQLIGEMILQLADEGVELRIDFLNEAQHKIDDNSSLASILISPHNLKTLARIVGLQLLQAERQELQHKAQYHKKRISYLEEKLAN